jgi:hypothetical protein
MQNLATFICELHETKSPANAKHEHVGVALVSHNDLLTGTHDAMIVPGFARIRSKIPGLAQDRIAKSALLMRTRGARRLVVHNIWLTVTVGAGDGLDPG